MMSSRERVEAAFEKRETDRVPVCHVSCSAEVASILMGREAFVGFGIQQWREATALWNGPDAHREFLERTFQDTLEVNRLMGNDLFRMVYPRHPVKPTRRIDENTFLYEYGEESSWRVLRYDPSQEHINVVFDYRPRPAPTFEDLERGLAAREKAMERPAEWRLPEDDPSVRAQLLYGDRVAIRMAGGGVSIPRDEIWLEAVALRPDLVGRHLDLQVEGARRTVGPTIRAGFRYLFGGGDFAGYRGPMYSPRAFRELVLPRLRQVTDLIHAHGGYSLFASDGDLWPVAEDLFGRSGVDGFYEIDRRAGMDLRRLRERFPDLTLIGNLHSQTLHRGTREEVVAEVRSCLEEARECRGVLVGVSNLPMPGTPAANVAAMIETIDRHR